MSRHGALWRRWHWRRWRSRPAAALAHGLAGAGSRTAERHDRRRRRDASRIPLYSKWAQEYSGKSNDVKLNYQSIGSGGGISAIKAKTVDFGASDAPLEHGAISTPRVSSSSRSASAASCRSSTSAASPTDQLKLTADAARQDLPRRHHEVERPGHQAAQPRREASRPGKISVVHRSDSSGTTWIFTNYLDAAAGVDVWKVGADKEVAWPAGVGGKGNEGVAASVQQLKGAIGYVEYAYAKETGIVTTQLKNADGKWVEPSLDAFSAAAAKADWQGPTASTWCSSTSRAPPRGRSPAPRSSWSRRSRRTPRAPRPCSSSSTGRYRTAQTTAEEPRLRPDPGQRLRRWSRASWKTITAAGKPSGRSERAAWIGTDGRDGRQGREHARDRRADPGRRRAAPPRRRRAAIIASATRPSGSSRWSAALTVAIAMFTLAGVLMLQLVDGDQRTGPQLPDHRRLVAEQRQLRRRSRRSPARS